MKKLLQQHWQHLILHKKATPSQESTGGQLVKSQWKANRTALR
jgi:hypothetical protein